MTVTRQNFIFLRNLKELDGNRCRSILVTGSSKHCLTSLRQHQLIMHLFGRHGDHIIPAAKVDILERVRRLARLKVN